MRGMCGGEGAAPSVRCGGVARRGRRGGAIGPISGFRQSSAFAVDEAIYVRAVDAPSARGRGLGGRDHGHSCAPTSVTETSTDFPDVGKALSLGSRGGHTRGRGVIPHSPSESVWVGGARGRVHLGHGHARTARPRRGRGRPPLLPWIRTIVGRG